MSNVKSERCGNDWTVTISQSDGSEQSLRLTNNQYGRYLAWQHSSFSIEKMLPELNNNEQKFLMSGQGPPLVATNT